MAKVRKNSVGKPEITPCAAGLCLGYRPISWPRLLCKLIVEQDQLFRGLFFTGVKLKRC